MKNSNIRENHFEIHTTCQNQNACATVDVPDVPMYFTLKVMCAHVRTCDLNSRYDEVEVQVELQVCTKYSAYFEMSKG